MNLINPLLQCLILYLLLYDHSIYLYILIYSDLGCTR